jgi:hypothetical protein
MEAFEVTGAPYREWIVPVAVLNDTTIARIETVDNEDEVPDYRFPLLPRHFD